MRRKPKAVRAVKIIPYQALNRTRTKYKTLKVCLAASGGGHLRQLLEMLPVVNKYDYYFLTEKTPLGVSVRQDEKTRFVTHLALGQRKAVGLPRYLWAIGTNFLLSVWHFLRERPDVIISTGAGATYFTLVVAKLTGCKIIYFESIARVNSMSNFGKRCSKMSDLYLVQWPNLAKEFSYATYCNPFTQGKHETRTKRDKIFVTVGTVMPFDRLIGYVENLKESDVITEEIVAQVGDSDIASEAMEVVQRLTQPDLLAHLEESSIAIVHGGSGSMLGAMRAGCVVIAIPREHDRGEHYDDHQFELVGAFREQDLVIEVRSEEELAKAIVEARTRSPKAIEISSSSYGNHIDRYINQQLM